MTSSVRQVAERYTVGQHTVLGWIASGELTAINVARNPAGKPRWRITSEALQAFEMLRAAQPATPEPRRRRRRQAAGAVEFY
jgi:transposase